MQESYDIYIYWIMLSVGPAPLTLELGRPDFADFFKAKICIDKNISIYVVWTGVNGSQIMIESSEHACRLTENKYVRMCSSCHDLHFNLGKFLYSYAYENYAKVMKGMDVRISTPRCNRRAWNLCRNYYTYIAIIICYWLVRVTRRSSRPDPNYGYLCLCQNMLSRYISVMVVRTSVLLHKRLHESNSHACILLYNKYVRY